MKTCSHCGIEKHESEFRPGTKSAKCKPCLKAKDAAYYQANKDKWVERDKALREKDPEAFKIKTREAQARYRANPENTIKLRYLKKRYGIDIDQFVAMEIAQDGRCMICGERPDDGKRLHVDHDHATSKVRDLLCFKHNTLLGNAGDSVKILKACISYLLRHGVKDDSEEFPQPQT
jgi:hypothetical protein